MGIVVIVLAFIAVTVLLVSGIFFLRDKPFAAKGELPLNLVKLSAAGIVLLLAWVFITSPILEKRRLAKQEQERVEQEKRDREIRIEQERKRIEQERIRTEQERRAKMLGFKMLGGYDIPFEVVYELVGAVKRAGYKCNEVHHAAPIITKSGGWLSDYKVPGYYLRCASLRSYRIGTDGSVRRR